MAVEVASLQATLDLTKRGFDAGIKGARDSLGKLGGGLGKLGPLAATGFGAAAAAAAGAGVAIGAVGAAVFNLARETDAGTKQIASGLGISADAANEYKDSLQAIFATNPKAEFDEIAEALVTTERAFDDLNKQDLEGLAGAALKLEQRFESDVNETIDAAAQLVREFGISGDQAMDLITSGMQNIPADDLLDTVREYSNQFGDAGFSADQFFSILQSGAAGGVLGTDKVADAVKELGIRLNEGGKDAAEAFAQVTGFALEDVASSIASGDEAWADYFDNIVAGLSSIEDPIERQAAAVALFGTQAEDLGADILAGLNPAAVTLDSVAGSTETLNAQFDNLGDAFESIKRQGLVALAPIGDSILELVNSAVPKIKSAFESVAPSIRLFAEQAVPIIESFVSGLGPAFSAMGDAVTRIASALGLVSGESGGASAALTVLEGILFGVTIAVEAIAGNMLIAAEIVDMFSDGIDIAIGLGKQIGQIFSAVWDLIRGGIESVANVLNGLIGGIRSFGETLSSIGDMIPDWLKPGSPPPLAHALGDIKAGLDALPKMDDVFGSDAGTVANATQTPMFSSGSDASSNITINIDGVSATTTVTGGGDASGDVIRLVLDMLTQQLERQAV